MQTCVTISSMRDRIIKYILPGLAAFLSLVFCVLWTHDHSSGLERAFFYPDMSSEEYEGAGDDEEVSVDLDGEYSSPLSYEGKRLKNLGIRLASQGDAEGTVTVSLKDSAGSVLSGSLPVSEINGSGYTVFEMNGALTPGNVLFSVDTDASGVQVYNRVIYGEKDVLYDGPQLKLTESSFPEKLLILLILLVFIACVAVYLPATRISPSWEKIFVLQYLLMGILFMSVFAPLAEPDSGNHFKRVLSVTQGHPIGLPSEDGQIGDNISWPEDWETDDNVNLTLYDAVLSMDFHMNGNPARRLNFTNIALYSPFSYTAPVAGAFIARLFTDRLMVILLASRLANYLLTGLLLFFAVRIAPFGKRYILWITALPLFMQQAVGVAPDSMLTALSILLLSIALRQRYRSDRVESGELASLYVLTFLLSQYKIVYLLFALFVFLIPPKNFGSKGRYAFHVAVMGSFTAASALVWLKISSGMLSTGYALADSQTEKMFTRPLEYLLAIFRTYGEEGFSYVAQLLGRNLGSFAFTTNPTVLLLLFTLLLYGVMSVRKKSVRVDGFTVTLLSAVMIFTAFLITTAEYIQWNDGINLIKGIQGRYFLPFLFPVFILLCGDDTPVPAGSAGHCAEDRGIVSGPSFSDRPVLYPHWLLLLCFVPQILLFYMYGSLR